MNEFLNELTLAATHAARAASALIPPRTRRHIEVIGHELAALLAELSASPDDRQDVRPATRARRIDIEE